LASKIELSVWIITLVVVIIYSVDIIQGLNGVRFDIKPFLKNNAYTGSNKDNEILIKSHTKKEEDILMNFIKKFPEDKYALLRSLEIKNNELYVVLYNNVPCIMGELKDLNKKIEVALEILNTAKRQGIEIAEIDLRTLKLPVIKEVKKDEENH